MRLRELLDKPCALVPLTDPAALDRELRWVVTTDLPDPSRYLKGGELVVTGLIWRKGPEDTERFVGAIARTGASALAAGNAGDEDLPADLLSACKKHRLPLLRVPGELAFATLTEYVVRRVSGQRASDLGSVLERHRRLVAAADPAQALGAILELISADLGLACWVVEASGKTVASCGQELPESERVSLARAAVSASTLPTRVTVSAGDASATSPAVSGGKRARRSVFPIDNHDRITDWYLVLDGDWRQWDPQRRSVVDQVTDVLAAERARLTERSAGWRVDAERLVRDIAAGTAGADVAKRLADLGFAECLSGDDDDADDADRDHNGGGEHDHALSRFRALAVAIPQPHPLPLPHPPTDRGSRPGAILEAAFSADPDSATYAAAFSLVAEFDEDPATGLQSHAICIVPEEGGGADPQKRLGDWLDKVVPGLGPRRIGIGISAPTAAASPTQLRRAVDDARHALRLAVTKPGPVTFVGQNDIASHALLLASVPEDVRDTYCDRMLGPILEYDRVHHSELETTLDAFLRASGSWIKCAAAMHVHVNTLRYRISRIEELVGRPLTLLETQADLLLALKLRAEQGS